MRKKTKTWLTIAFLLTLTGCILFTGVIAALNWDFRNLSTTEYKTNTYAVREAFDSISVRTDTADVVFVLSPDDSCTVECVEEENAKHSVTVENGILTVELMDERTFADHIGIHIGSPRITVYLPEGEYGSLLIRESTGDVEIPEGLAFRQVDIALTTGDVSFKASASGLIRIKTSTGAIRAEGISAGGLDLSVTTGRVTVSQVRCRGDITIGVTTGKAYLTEITCGNLISQGSTGDISLDHVIAAETFSIRRTTGDIRFSGSDAAGIYVETSTGDVTGELLSDKNFITQTGTGDVDVPKTASGGTCDIVTGTGNIRITVTQS